jgi:hypothetical protein
VDDSAGPRTDGRRPPDISFDARDNATIGGQFGVVNGDVHVYDAGPARSPSERLAVARNLLDGGMPRQAEEMFRDAIQAGLRSNEVAYYWALSVLSGRSFDQLRKAEFDTLHACSRTIVARRPDGWAWSLNVIMKLINCLLQQGQPAANYRALHQVNQAFDQVIREYGALPGPRREEIRRHLDQIMAGALQDLLDGAHSQEAARLRLDGGRSRRAWKFFVPVPLPPRPRALPEHPRGEGSRVTAIAGAAIAGVALALVFAAAVSHSPPMGLLFALGTGGGGMLAAIAGQRFLADRELIAIDEARHGAETVRDRYSLVHAYPPALRRTGSSSVQQRVDAHFEAQVPSGASRRRWQAETEGLRVVLAADVHKRFPHADDARRLDWLLRCHAARARQRREQGGLRSRRARLKTDSDISGAMACLGGCALLAGLIGGMIGLFSGGGNPRYGLILLAAVGAGGAIVYVSRIDAYLVRRQVYLAESELAAEENAAEQAAFNAWAKALADRPADAEMVRWLDYDKLHAKSLFLRQTPLANRDIVAHFVLAAAHEPCSKARVLFGPPRYSSYRLVIFLLTRKGVWLADMDLDFLTGKVSNNGSHSFGYGAIVRAQIVRSGASQTLWLSLRDSTHIEIAVEDPGPGLMDPREQPDVVRELALDASGVPNVMRMLQAVSAEGAGWLDEERERRDRRLLDWKQGLRHGRDLPRGATGGTLPAEPDPPPGAGTLGPSRHAGARRYGSTGSYGNDGYQNTDGYGGCRQPDSGWAGQTGKWPGDADPGLI